jgi:hypothetical protein
MGAFVYRWVRHDVTQGQCVRCQRALEQDGIVCCRLQMHTGEEDMRFLGPLDWATACRQEGL